MLPLRSKTTARLNFNCALIGLAARPFSICSNALFQLRSFINRSINAARSVSFVGSSKGVEAIATPRVIGAMRPAIKRVFKEVAIVEKYFREKSLLRPNNVYLTDSKRKHSLHK